MPLLHKFEIRTNDLSISRVRERNFPVGVWRDQFRDLVAVAIGISVLSFHYCQPASAQVVHVEDYAAWPFSLGHSQTRRGQEHARRAPPRWTRQHPPAPPPRLLLLVQPRLAEQFRM